MKKTIVALIALIICGILLITLTGCGNEETTYSEETSYSEEANYNGETSSTEEITTSEENHQEVEYEFLQVVSLKDNSKWIVLEHSDGYVELLSTGSKFQGSYNKDDYPGKDIFDRLEEYTTQLKSNLNSNGADTSSIDVRIPTIEDFEKYFDTSSSDFLNGHGIVFDSEQYQFFSQYFTGKWHMVNSAYPDNENRITVYSLSNNYKSFWFLKGGQSKDYVLQVAVILRTPIENIINDI